MKTAHVETPARAAPLETQIPPPVLDALDIARNLVDGAEDLDGMFRTAAATVFRTAKQTDPHWQKTVDEIDRIGEQAGLYDDQHRQDIMEAGIKDARQPAPNGKRATIITPADLQTFFGDWHTAIGAAPDREAKWQEFAAAVRGKLLTMEIGRNVATDNLRLIAVELDLCTATELDAKVTAALDGVVPPRP